MTRFIYRKSGDSNIYDASTNQRISASDFGSGAGFQELKAIDGAKYNTKDLQTANYDNITPIGNTLYGLQKQGAVAPVSSPTPSIPSNQLNASTLSTGLNAGNVASQLPSSNVQAQQVYSQNLLSDSQNNAQKLQEQYNNIQAKQLQETSSNLKQAQTDLSNIQGAKQAEATSYDQTMNPINEKIKTQYNSMVDSLNNYNYNDLVKQKIDLTNNITEYAKMMNDELNSNASSTSFSSIMQGRSATIKDNYTSKIATAQAAMSAIDGNFTLAEDIMSKASNAIQSTLTDRISFLQSVNALYATKESDAKTKVDSLTTDQKALIDKASSDLKAKIDTVNKSKEAIMTLMQDNPIVAQKAGLTLTDTEEQRAAKLQNFYVKNPQYTSDNQAYIKSAMQKYYDAGITLNDPLETVKSKILMSKVYEKEIAGKYTYTSDGKILNTATGEYKTDNTPTSENNYTDTSKGIVGGFNISSYATDPTHEQKIANIYTGLKNQGINDFASIQDVLNKYNAPFTAEQILQTAKQYNIEPEMIMAMIQQDSSYGTAGKGARTFNPGNVGNNDNGNIRNYYNWQAGLDAVGNWLDEHRIDTESGAKTDAQLIADAIINGNQPPEVKGLYGKSAGVKAELEKRGFDLSKANLDWQAVQKWTASANSSAQIRMRQAENSVELSLGNLKTLSDDFSRSGYKFVNKADLVAASNGVFGQDAAKKAQALLGQVALITDELGQTFMGGNSPTDSAFGLATKVLQGDFSKDVLNNQIELIGKNLQYRKNSWTNAGPVSVGGGDNQYNNSDKNVGKNGSLDQYVVGSNNNGSSDLSQFVR